MKKIAAAFIALPVLTGGGVFYLAGLGGTDIVRDGATEYVIVRPDGCEFEVTAAANKLSKAIKQETGAVIKVVTDKEPLNSDGAEQPKEILIGNTSRAASAECAEGLLSRDYAVGLYDSSLVITAGGTDIYSDAVDHVINEMITDGSFRVKRGYRYTSRAQYEISSIELCGTDISEYVISYTDEASKKYAESFSDSLTDKKGASPEISDTAFTDKNEIIFGNADSSIPLDSYGISAHDGDITVSAPTGMGLEAAYAEFSELIFGKEGTKNVKADTFNIIKELSPTSEHSGFCTVRTPLSNARAKLTEDKKLRVAYFGGSVTVGYGATDAGKLSWRALTTQWLRENFPQAEITEINAAIGATGTHLGAFRTERDIISQKPDLLFIEFAVNDSYNGESAASAAENYEAIVRRVRRELPDCDIVNVYITDSSKTAGGGDFIQANAHETIAEAYGITGVNVGKALAKKHNLKGNTSSNWKDYFIDIVHMSDKGYAEYADVMTEYLANELIFAENASPAAHTLPSPVKEGSERELQYIIPTADMLGKTVGYTYNDGTFENLAATPYKGYLTTSAAENSLEFTFTGSELSLFMSSFTSGSIKYTVDGEKSGTATRNSMNNPFPVVKNLEYGEHTIKLEIVFGDTKTANIGAFLVR